MERKGSDRWFQYLFPFPAVFVLSIHPIISSWGLNASGQLGLGHTDDVGAEEGTMGDALPAVEPGLRLAFPPSPTIAVDENSSTTSDTAPTSSNELSVRHAAVFDT